ncbi:MAG: DUF4340 domain-containing protein [Roseburia sp.]
MRKQKKQFVILLILLVICVAALVFLMLYNKHQEELEEAENATISLVPVEPEEIQAFSYYYGDDLLEFRRKDDTWYYTEDESVELDQGTMGKMLESMTGIVAAQELEEPAELSEYGLDEPSNTITIMTEDGAYVVLTGSSNGITGQYYIKLSNSDQVYLTDTDYNSAFQVGLETLAIQLENVVDTEMN